MKPTIVAAVSGGPDSVYLLRILSSEKRARIVVGHVNYRTRGADSEKDQKMVEKLGKSYGYETVIYVVSGGGEKGNPGRAEGDRGDFPAGFEKGAREIRYRFLKDLSGKVGAERIALAHTADDQVETVLMRLFEGAGIGGLKGIPRAGDDGIVRPILDVWKEDILHYLKKRKIPYRIDRSNSDTRFERNWARHVLLPILEKRYGKSVRKRIFTLGERFREIDDYLAAEAGRWIRRNVKPPPETPPRLGAVPRDRGERSGRNAARAPAFPRKTFSALPSVLRVKILQRICFDRLGFAPNERLLAAMDRSAAGGSSSARVHAGGKWILENRYGEARFVPGETGRDRNLAEAPPGKKSSGGRPPSRGRPSPSPIALDSPGVYPLPPDRNGRAGTLVWKVGGKSTASRAKRIAEKGDAGMFDADALRLPLTVRPLRAGDRIRPFGGGTGGNGHAAGKKVKEILIDRKVPRDDRWGRSVLCDADGEILWIPGVLRSDRAPVTPETRRTAFLRIRPAK